MLQTRRGVLSPASQLRSLAYIVCSGSRPFEVFKLPMPPTPTRGGVHQSGMQDASPAWRTPPRAMTSPNTLRQLFSLANVTTPFRNESVGVAFVSAAQQGDVHTIRQLLPLARSVNVAARTVNNPLAITALHAAAAAGAHEVVELLLAVGADPSVRVAQHRGLTPLHFARDGRTATLLLNAGAPPIALDPRQPCPARHLRARERHDAADAIVHWRAERLPPPIRERLLGGRPLQLLPNQQQWSAHLGVAPPRSGEHVEHASRAAAHATPVAAVAASNNAVAPHTSVRTLVVIPAMSCAEVRAARANWAVWPAGPSAARYDVLVHELTRHDETECVVCMGSLLAEGDGPGEPLISLPCGGRGSDGPKPHVLHLPCAERWMLRKANCPICRQDIRRHLGSRRGTLAPCAVAAATSARDGTPRADLRPTATATANGDDADEHDRVSLENSGRLLAAGVLTHATAYRSPRAARLHSPRFTELSLRTTVAPHHSPRAPTGSPRTHVAPRTARVAAAQVSADAQGRGQSAMSLRELGSKLPLDRALGNGGKLWVGWRGGVRDMASAARDALIHAPNVADGRACSPRASPRAKRPAPPAPMHARAVCYGPLERRVA